LPETLQLLGRECVVEASTRDIVAAGSGCSLGGVQSAGSGSLSLLLGAALLRYASPAATVGYCETRRMSEDESEESGIRQRNEEAQ